MKIIRGSIGSKKKLGTNICLTIGNFDGVHLGHQSLIKETIQDGYTSVVMTFTPHPSCVCKPHFHYHFLTQQSRKNHLIAELKPDYLFIIDFDIKGASKSKDEFISWLKSLNVKKIICGPNYRFAHNATGTIDDLSEYFDVCVLPYVFVDDMKISSTGIKEYLSNGQIDKANLALGREYSIEGLVVKGSQIGVKLGFPTANIDIFGNTIPKKGVYAVKVKVNNKFYFGMGNIGHNPTCNYQLNERLEVHLFDFNGNLYGHNVIVYFLEYWREEIKFSDSEALINQLRQDCKEIKKYVSNLV